MTNPTTNPTTNPAERRAAPRTEVECPCKVFHRASGRYLPGRTTDVSSGGAMLWLDSARPMSAGDEVEIHIAWDAPGVVEKKRMLPASVVRLAARFAEHQAVAVRFAHTQDLATAA